MIDYEKLKLLQNLILKTSYVVDTTFGLDDLWFYLRNVDDESPDYNKKIEFDDIGELIECIKKLHQDRPKTNYEVGQNVFIRMNTEVLESTVIQLPDEYRKSYRVSLYDDWVGIDECDIYPSEKALIEAQIEMWQQKLIEEYCPPFEGEIKAFPERHECQFCGLPLLTENNRCIMKACRKKEEQSTYNDDVFTPSTQNLSSCCSVHAGKTDECYQEPEQECRHTWIFSSSKNQLCCYHCLKTKKQVYPFVDRRVDVQTNQDEADLHGCQHEFNFENAYAKPYPEHPKLCMGVYTKCLKCRYEVLVVADASRPDLIAKYIMLERNFECQHESDEDWFLRPYREKNSPEIILHFKCKHCGEFYR